MPFIGSIIPQSLAGTEPPKPAQRAREKRRALTPEHAEAPRDEAELSSASAVDSSETVRSTKGNADEESHDDRASQGYYTAQGTNAPAAPGAHRLDIEG